MEEINKNEPLNNEFCDINNFILNEYKGQGSFGKVYRVVEKKTGKIYAAKISIETFDDYSESYFTNLSREVNIISKLNHPSVLKFKGFSPINFKKKRKPVIITEYVSNGTLDDLLEQERNSTNSILDDTSKLIIIYGIASAMQYLHSHNIIHRDLKPGNILLNEYLFPKIADFGLSKINHSNIESMTFQSDINTIKGTPIYISPEIWQQNEYSKSGDVYAYSIILYEIMTNQKPFSGLNLLNIAFKVSDGYRPEFKTKIPKAYHDLIEYCWSDDPHKRPTFDEIIEKLKNDRSFITEKVDERIFLNFINYIENYNVSFDQSKVVIQFDKKINNQLNTRINEYFSNDLNLFPFKCFMKLDDSCKKLVIEAEKDVEKQFLLAKCLIEGQGFFPYNNSIGLKYLHLTMRKGNFQSFVYFINMLIKGDIIHKNYKKAKKLLEKIVKEKDLGIYYYLYGQIYKREKNIPKAKEFFKKSISIGNSDSMFEYARILYKEKGFFSKAYQFISNIFHKKDECFTYFHNAIENGCIKAMYKYGQILRCDHIIGNIKEGKKYIKMAADHEYPAALYHYSLILEAEGNLKDSNSYLKKAAYKGNASAMSDYGFLLSKQKNYYESSLFLEKACEKGEIESMYFYGVDLYKGNGVSKNHHKSAQLMKIAADGGIGQAMGWYAIMCKQGIGVESNLEETIKYLKMAIDKGNTDSMNDYGIMLLKGEGIPINKDEACKYFKMAADKGNEDALVNYSHMLEKGYGVKQNLEEALKHYKLLIDQGNTSAMYNLALVYKNGEGVPVNKEEAVKYFKMAADYGNIDGMFWYAYALYEGEGVPVNKEEAFKFYKMAADKGDSYAMYNYAYMLDKGDGVPVNKIEAAKFYKMAADKGNSNAMYNYALMLEKGDGVPINKEEALKYFKMAADKGNSNAMYNYALMLYKGNGTSINKEEAFKYFKIAADKGDSDAMFSFAFMLEKGETVPVNKKEAVKYYIMASEKGDSDAMFNYAYMLEKGDGVPVNKEDAVKYYLMAIKEGNSNAMLNYAYMLDKGDGVHVNKIEAAKFYKMAADKGNSNAMNNYALMLDKGDGVDVNKEEAIKYYQMAIEKGNLEAIHNYEHMHKKED